MIREFLRMEMASPRYEAEISAALAKHGATAKLLLDADLSSDTENRLRREVLGSFRGYGQNRGLFERFPRQVDWYRAEMTAADLPQLCYIDYSYWNELSHHTGSPLMAAKTVESGLSIYDVPNDQFHEARRQLQEGRRFPTLILLGERLPEKSKGTVWYLLEGHVRATAYAMAPECMDQAPVLLGIADQSELQYWHDG